jgi:hypothetical protein
MINPLIKTAWVFEELSTGKAILAVAIAIMIRLFSAFSLQSSSILE